MEIGQRFTYIAHGREFEAIFKEQIGEYISCIIVAPWKFAGNKTLIKNDKIKKNSLMKQPKNLRILHFLSPVKWKNDLFISDADANFKVMKKTVEFLPECHHYIMMPRKYTEKLSGANITNIRYDYPASVFLNRYLFDHKKVVGFDFDKIDVDFIFNHQPEQTLSLQVWFGANRYYRDIHTFNFFHWIDCRDSGGGFKDVQPINFMRQFEATVVGDVNFFHTQKSVNYLLSNFKEMSFMPEIKNATFMPLSGSKTEVKSEFKMPEKKVIVFNHRWNKSSGVERFLKYTENFDDDYVFWITDDKNCDVQRDNFIIKSLNYEDFNFLMSNCHCNVTFIDGYTTWNLSAQDALIRNRPAVVYDHEITNEVCFNRALTFKTKEEFINQIKNVPDRIESFDHKIHDEKFKTNLITALNNLWEDTKQVPKAAEKFFKTIKEHNIRTKYEILSKVHDKVISNGSNHGIRRHCLHNGLRDDITEPYPTYYFEDEMIIKQPTLFS